MGERFGLVRYIIFLRVSFKSVSNGTSLTRMVIGLINDTLYTTSRARSSRSGHDKHRLQIDFVHPIVER